MSRTFDITLGEITYSVPAFNLRQLREVARLTDGQADKAEAGFIILALALKRATPAVEDFETMLDTIVPEPGQFEQAMKTVLQAAGLVSKDDAPGEAQPAPVA